MTAHAWRGANRQPLQEWQMRPFNGSAQEDSLRAPTPRQTEAMKLMRLCANTKQLGRMMGITPSAAWRLVAEGRARVKAREAREQ